MATYQNSQTGNPMRDINLVSYEGAPISSGNPIPITGTITASNPSVGTDGVTAPTSATEIGWIDLSGNLQGVSAANPLPVSASVSVSETVLNVTGSISSAATLSNFPVTNTAGYRTAVIQVINAGSTCTLVAETSNDGTTWVGLQSVDDTTTETTPMTSTGQFIFVFSALQFRVRCSIYGSGTPAVNVEFRQYPVTIKMRDLLNTINTTLLAALPAGTNLIGSVELVDSGGTNRASISAGGAIKVDGSAVTQPVSGTVTANQSDITPILANALSTTVKTVVASVAAKLEDYYCYNPNASVMYVQIFDVATSGAVTLGTTVPKWSIGIPATGAANLTQLNLAFASGIQVAATTTATGSSAPGTALDCNFGYR